MPSNCQFLLNHSNAVYYSGETISGTVNLTTTTEKTVRNVRIVILGEVKVKWDESHTTTDSNGSTTTHTTYFQSHEVYVNNESYVYGEGVLAVGLHSYTFGITLPTECPTSCEGSYGHIRYSLSLILDRPFRFNNVYHKPLTVLKTVDLNLRPIFKLPVLVEEIGTLCCCLCSRSNLLYALRIPFGAYTPGQNVQYSLCINNQTMTDTNGYSFAFSQTMTFVACSPRHNERSEKKVLRQQHFNDSCLRLTNRIFEGAFQIPSVPPTTDPYAIIRISYKLKVTVRMAGCHSNAHLSVPIFIGNIPLRESLSGYVAENHQVNASAPDLEPQASNCNEPPIYNNIQPPSYQESIQKESPFVDHDVDKYQREVGYRPLYPMYS